MIDPQWQSPLSDGDGATPAGRYAEIIGSNFTTPEMLTSPLESKTAWQTGEMLSTDHFSFAMLRVNDGGVRVEDWSNTTNSQAVVLSDRNLAGIAGAGARSIHAPDGDAWRGHVVYNDNHVELETSNILSGTRYTGALEHRSDDLFADDADPAGQLAADAAMVYQDGETYVNQR